VSLVASTTRRNLLAGQRTTNTVLTGNSERGEFKVKYTNGSFYACANFAVALLSPEPAILLTHLKLDKKDVHAVQA
jgi:hypothetical protein